MSNKKNTIIYNLVEIDGEKFILSHDDLINMDNEFIQNLNKGCNNFELEYIEQINVPIKYLNNYEKEECEREVFLTGEELKEHKKLDVYEKNGIWKSLNHMVLHQFM